MTAGSRAEEMQMKKSGKKRMQQKRHTQGTLGIIATATTAPSPSSATLLANN
jgi:hypothetical protein